MKQMEAVSPELVLVDPDLARTERARLASAQPLWAVIATSASPHVVAPVPALPVEARRQRTSFRLQEFLAACVLGASLFVNGYLLADRVVTPTEAAATMPSVAAAAPDVAADALAARPAASVAQATASAEIIAPGPRTVASRIEAERRVLARVVQAPAGKLPAKLIDRSSGLAKNNL